MSGHEPTQPGSHTFDYKHVGGRFLGLVALAVVAFGLVAYGAISDSKQFAFSYLFAFFFFFTICMGGLFWQLVHHAVDAEWSVVVRRQMENLGSLLVVMGVLFIPLVFVAPTLWTWMTIDPAHDIVLGEKAGYLNNEFFWIRAGFYFCFFTIASLWLRSNSNKQDLDGAAKFTIRNRLRKTAARVHPMAIRQAISSQWI